MAELAAPPPSLLSAILSTLIRSVRAAAWWRPGFPDRSARQVDLLRSAVLAAPDATHAASPRDSGVGLDRPTATQRGRKLFLFRSRGPDLGHRALPQADMERAGV